MAWRNKEEEKLERREEDSRAEKHGREPGEKEKKTWKEIDAKRDGSRSSSRRDEPRPAKRETAMYKNYKSKLDKMFDGQVKARSGAPDVEVVRAKSDSDSKVASAAPSGASARVTSTSAMARAAALFANAPMASSDTSEPLSPKDQLKAAAGAADIEAAARACLATGGLPKDTELIGKVLSLDATDLQHAALEMLLDLSERGRPKNARVLLDRLRALGPQLLDPVDRDICAGLVARFG